MKATTLEKINKSIEETLKKTNDAINITPIRSNHPNLEKLIWEIRSKVEYSIILLSINIENGISEVERFNTSNLKDISNSLKLVSVVLIKIPKDLDSKNYFVALNNLREARDILNWVLNRIKKKILQKSYSLGSSFFAVILISSFSIFIFFHTFPYSSAVKL